MVVEKARAVEEAATTMDMEGATTTDMGGATTMGFAAMEVEALETAMVVAAAILVTALTDSVVAVTRGMRHAIPTVQEATVVNGSPTNHLTDRVGDDSHRCLS